MSQRLENDELFKVVKDFHAKENREVSSVEHPSLLPKLRLYQKEAVQWMIQRETCSVFENIFLENVEADEDDSSSHGAKGLPVARLPTGGILSDEMGLGKTVEVLACILNNPRGDVVIPIPKNIQPEDPKKVSETVQSHKKKATKKRKQKDDDDDWQPSSKSKKEKGSATKGEMEMEAKTECKEVELKGKCRSRAKILAQQWYESKLSEVNKNPIRAYRESIFEGSPNSSRNVVVQCICSETGEDGLMKCKSCSRWLHKKCIGALKWNGVQPVYCPQCWLKQTPVRSRATLIVSPTSISGQWLNEVKRHISKDANFKVLAYKGVRVDGFSQPYDFADYDLILTTYEILRHELCLAEVHERRSLRYEKRYFSPTCPLLCVDFWRICLDEAQIVEGHATAAAEMVSRFSSVHRWAVTGTPVQKSLQDLYGLVVFLCIEPYCNMTDWKNMLYEPFCNGKKGPMYTLLAHIMWRSSKIDVLDQIQIPQQTELLCLNDFSPVEQHFYLRTHQECSNDFLEKLSKFESLNWTLESLKVVTVNHILGPLLKLRQACSHPQAVRGNVLTAQKKTMTMPELLEALIKKTAIEAQDALRKHISSLNAIAGLHLICNEFVSAAEKYREVLQIADEYKGRVNVDTLQRIHTMHNLDEVIKCHRDVIPPTLRDDSLRDEAKNLQDNYLSKSQASVIAAEENLKVLSESVSLIEGKFSEMSNSNWWVDLCYVLDREEMLLRIHDALVNHRKSLADVSSSSIINRVSTINGVQVICNQWLEDIEKNQTKVRKELAALKAADSATLVNDAVDCHLRVSNLKSKKTFCQLCKVENILKNYETGLFDIKLKRNENTMVGDVYLLGQGKEGSWKPSEQETVLRTILSFGRQKKAENNLVKSGALFIKIMDALRKEFKPLRLLWSMINERTCAQDELNMCKLRLRLRLPEEAVPSHAISTNRRKSVPKKNNLSSNLDTKMENLHVIEIHQVETMIHQNKLEAASALSDLKKKYGTVAYLQNLRNKDDSKSNVEVCPVCRSNLEKKWAVLSCGHCYCMDCVSELFKKKQVLCAICRENTKFDEVSFVNPSSDDEIESTETENILPSVEGSHSTKVEAIIKKLFFLKAADPYVKVLVFSTWERVLDVLEEALTQNNVKHLRLRTGPKYELTLKLFKDQDEEDTVTALLLPLKLGSKGLNLTEATHVMMVEPVLNPAEELQAIGRVHRIGQTRPTFVHRFLIKDTIEERMFSAVQATGKEKWSGKQVTLQQLKDLFTSSQSAVPGVQTSSSSILVQD